MLQKIKFKLESLNCNETSIHGLVHPLHGTDYSLQTSKSKSHGKPRPGDSVGWSIIPYTKQGVCSIPSQGTCQGVLGLIPSQGVYGRQLMILFSLSLSQKKKKNQ